MTCPCDRTGTEEDICDQVSLLKLLNRFIDDKICSNNMGVFLEIVFKLFHFQETAECKCKKNVVTGGCCDTCVEGTFDLQDSNPDGCTDCICSGKTKFCRSHNHLVRSTVRI